MHTRGMVLSVNADRQVVIEEDCGRSRQRWYIYYSNERYHFVNKLYDTDVMEATYDSTNVSVGWKYDYCCWWLEQVPIGYAEKEVLTERDKALMSALQIIYGKYKSLSSSIANDYRMDELIRSMREIRNKDIYEGYFSGYYDGLSIKYPNIKTTKVQINQIKQLTSEDIQKMHNSDSVIIFLGSLVPGAGMVLAPLAQGLRDIEQNGKIDFLGLSIGALEDILLKDNQLFGLLLSSMHTLDDVVRTDGKDTYVKDGVRMTEGDICIDISIRYRLGMSHGQFTFIFRNGIALSSEQYGPYDADKDKGGAMGGFPQKHKWIEDGYILDPEDYS